MSGVDLDIFYENTPRQLNDSRDLSEAMAGLAKADLHTAGINRSSTWELLPFAIEMETAGVAMSREYTKSAWIPMKFPEKIQLHPCRGAPLPGPSVEPCSNVAAVEGTTLTAYPFRKERGCQRASNDETQSSSVPSCKGTCSSLGRIPALLCQYRACLISFRRSKRETS